MMMSSPGAISAHRALAGIKFFEKLVFSYTHFKHLIIALVCIGVLPPELLKRDAL